MQTQHGWELAREIAKAREEARAAALNEAAKDMEEATAKVGACEEREARGGRTCVGVRRCIESGPKPLGKYDGVHATSESKRYGRHVLCRWRWQAVQEARKAAEKEKREALVAMARESEQVASKEHRGGQGAVMGAQDGGHPDGCGARMGKRTRMGKLQRWIEGCGFGMEVGAGDH